MKVVELGKRCGLKASQVDGEIGYVSAAEDPEGKGYHIIQFISCTPPTADGAEKKERFFGLLGLHNTATLKGPELEDLEDKIDRALSLAPRARTVG